MLQRGMSRLLDKVINNSISHSQIDSNYLYIENRLVLGSIDWVVYGVEGACLRRSRSRFKKFFGQPEML